MSIKYLLLLGRNFNLLSVRILNIPQFDNLCLDEIEMSYDELSQILQKDIGEYNKITRIRIYSNNKNETTLYKSTDCPIKIRKMEEKKFEVEVIESSYLIYEQMKRRILKLRNELFEIENLFHYVNKKLLLERNKELCKNSSNLNLNLIYNDSIIGSPNFFSNLNSESLDFAFIFSCPLIIGNNGSNNIELNLFDYEKDLLKIQQSLEKANCEINIISCIGTIENLQKVFSKEPKILHILCHGAIQNDEIEHYLCFENYKFDGKAKVVTESAIIENLKYYEKEIKNLKLLFLNSCHSENIGKAFRKLGC